MFFCFLFQIYTNLKFSRLSGKMIIDNSLISENCDVTNRTTDLLSIQICCNPVIICKSKMQFGLPAQMKLSPDTLNNASSFVSLATFSVQAYKSNS